jgi:competence protein ComEA
MDGQQFVVPRVGERLTSTVPPSGGGFDSGPSGVSGGNTGNGASNTPRVGERLTSTVPSLGSVVGGQSAGDTGINPGVNLGAPLLVDLNQATVAELDQLPGVGPSTARAIIDHRTRNGPFASVDDLLAVRGIGPAKLAELKPFVRV